MKIIVSHVYSNDNKGDSALLSVLLQDLKRVFPGSEILILTMDRITLGEKFEDTPMGNGFMYHAVNRYKNSFFKLVYSLFVIVSTLTYAYMYKLFGIKMLLPKHLNEVTDAYHNADLVVSVGGGYIRAKSGLINTLKFLFLIQPIIFSKIISNIIVGYPQSIGPFGNKIQEILAKYALQKMDGIVVREKISLKILNDLGIKDKVLLSVDSGFLFKNNTTQTDLKKYLGISNDKNIVGITIRDWLPKNEQSKYERAVAVFADYIISKYEMKVVFIPQVTSEHYGDDDRQPSNRVYAFMKNSKDAYVVKERYDHHTIKSIYSNLDFLVGMRFHSVIFALTSLVPSIALEYEHKTSGIMKDLGLSKWVIKVEDVTADRLRELFDELVLEKNTYITYLEKILPKYTKDSDQVAEFVRKIYSENVLSKKYQE